MKTKTTATTDTPAAEPWINSNSACLHLDISNPTLRRWIKAGRLNPKRTPTGEFRFRRSELDSLLD